MITEALLRYYNNLLLIYFVQFPEANYILSDSLQEVVRLQEKKVIGFSCSKLSKTYKLFETADVLNVFGTALKSYLLRVV